MESKSKIYKSYPDYMTDKGEGYIPSSAIEMAHLAARAAASGLTDKAALHGKAAVEAMTAYAKEKGYKVALTEYDTTAMAVVSPAKSPDDKGEYTVTPEDRYLERLVRFGRATKIKTVKAAQRSAAGKDKAVKAASPAADLSALTGIDLTALAKALEVLASLGK